MDLLTAHGLFAQLPSDELFALLPPDLEFRGGLQSDVAKFLPLYATGMALLSGGLSDATTVDDLRECCSHARSLWDAEICGPDELNAAAGEVFKGLQLAFEPDYSPRHEFAPHELN